MTLLQYLSTLPCLPLPSGNVQTPFPSIPWCYIPISSSVFLSFLLLLLSLQNCLRHARGSWDVAISSEFPFLNHSSEIIHSNCILDSVANFLVCPMVFVGNVQKSRIASHLKGLDLSIDFCCQGPALTGIKKVDKMSVRISLTFEASEMNLSLHMIFNLERALCAILERISGLDPSLEMTAPRYLKFFTSSSLWPFILISLWKLLGLFVITFVLSGSISIFTLWWLYRNGLPGRQLLLPLLHFDNVICKAEVGNKSSSDADTTFYQNINRLTCNISY